MSAVVPPQPGAADCPGDVDDPTEEEFDRLAEEFADRCRVGESPSIGDYEARYPALAEKIRGVFPTVAMMEQLKRDSRSVREKESPRPLPKALGEYRIVRELGRGGMGVVYEAVQEPLGRHVAVKALHSATVDVRRLERFRREAQAIAQLHHTNIVPIFAIGEHEGLPFYAMQCIRGRSLDVVLGEWRQGKPPGAAERSRLAAEVGLQAADALQYAHEQGVLHRDIKPANLLIDDHRVVWVTDFGLAKLVGREDLTTSGDVIGTLRYLAPESLQGQSGPGTDIYSLGVTLYEMLTLSPPYGEVNPSTLLREVAEANLPRPRKLDSGIPRDLETILLKAIAREPRHRYATAGALASDLRCFLEDRPIQARRATAIERVWRWSRRNRMTAALASTAAASLILAAIVGWLGYAQTTKALARADRNVALSLAVFEDLFEKLSSNDELRAPPLGQDDRRDFGPGRDRGGPPFDRPGPGPGGDRMPPPDEGGRRPPPGGRGERRPPPGERGGPPPGFDPGGPPDRPPPGFDPGPPPGGPFGPQSSLASEQDTALLRSVLSFYDRFARENATDPRLQGEAAWAYRKVGALSQRLGLTDEAEAAYKRAIEVFEGLVARYPREASYRFKLTQTYDMADPWSLEGDALVRAEARLRRARSLADGLVAADPSVADYARVRFRVTAKLAIALQRLGRLDEAEKTFLAALSIDVRSGDQSVATGISRVDHAVVRESLALLQIEQGRKDDATAQLNAAADELKALAGADRVPPSLGTRFRSLAQIYTKLGLSAQADAMTQQSDEAATRRPEPPPDERNYGRGPGGPSDYRRPPGRRRRPMGQSDP